MKFIFADSLDRVDPNFDFIEDQTRRGRFHPAIAHAHELIDPAPYDGVLISRSTVGDHRFPGKYTLAQRMRLQREGARKFLRLDSPRFKDMMIFGDCGAFSYVKEQTPCYTCTDILGFYSDAQFTHGCSVDHIITEFDPEHRGRRAWITDSVRERFELTLENAREFLQLSKPMRPGFTPVGVVQGWSPSSMADAAAQVIQMGYSYIALGGLARLRTPEICRCLSAVRERIGWTTRIHLLGFAKEDIHEIAPYGVDSFDSTSPLLRAFKDARANYYLLTERGLEYYSAIRIPPAHENRHLVYAAREGKLNQEQLLRLETDTLRAVRGYDRGTVTLQEAVERATEYASLLAIEGSARRDGGEKLRAGIRASVTRTLSARPWSRCGCRICRTAGVEVLIYRGTNRNKRRGFHNLGVYFEHLRRLRRS